MSLPARIEALRAAMQVRTPGTSPDQTVATAQRFLDWLEPPAEKPEAIAKSGQPPRR